MTGSAIRAVLWDFGGVITSSPFDAFNRYEAEHGLPRDFLRSVNSHDADGNAWALLERSEIGVEEFSRRFEAESAALGHAVPGHEVLALLDGDIRDDMVSALRHLSRHYRTACLTNNVRSGHGPAMNRDAQRAERVAAILALFDDVLESSRAGVRKPEPRFYTLACERLGIEPGEAVYMDDLGINLKPARALGMRTIKVTDPGAALRELEQVLGHRIGTAPP